MYFKDVKKAPQVNGLAGNMYFKDVKKAPQVNGLAGNMYFKGVKNSPQVNVEEIKEEKDDLDKFMKYNNLKDLILNKSLRKLIFDELETLESALTKIFIDKYLFLTSNNVLKLLDILDIDSASVESIKMLMVQKYTAEKKYMSLYEVLYEYITKLLDDKSIYEVPQFVIKSSKNSEISNTLEDLKLDSYEKVLKYFENFKLFEKDSASDSIVFTASLKSISKNNSTIDYIRKNNLIKSDMIFYFKIFPLLTDTYIKNGKVYNFYMSYRLTLEQKIYSELFKLVKYNITPNILCKVATSNIDNIFDHFIMNKHLDKTFIDNLIGEITKFNTKFELEPDRSWINTGAIITQPGGVPFYDFYNSCRDEFKLKKIIFQLLYTLYVFEKIQFSHGDLHLGNIFVVDVDETELCYIVNKKQFKFKTNQILKIYDFDFSSICKDTNIEYDEFHSFTINKNLNKERSPDHFLNKFIPNVFNKQSDIIHAFLWLYNRKPENYDLPNIFMPEFNFFMKTCFSGFHKDGKNSNKTIRATYNELLHDNKNLLKEVNRIFGVVIGNISQIHRYGINPEYLDMTWLDYAKKVLSNERNYPIKTPIDLFNNSGNNQLWIPDTIVSDKLEMLNNLYFRDLVSVDSIDVRKIPVYSIDDRIYET